MVEEGDEAETFSGLPRPTPHWDVLVFHIKDGEILVCASPT